MSIKFLERIGKVDADGFTLLRDRPQMEGLKVMHVGESLPFGVCSSGLQLSDVKEWERPRNLQCFSIISLYLTLVSIHFVYRGCSGDGSRGV